MVTNPRGPPRVARDDILRRCSQSRHVPLPPPPPSPTSTWTFIDTEGQLPHPDPTLPFAAVVPLCHDTFWKRRSSSRQSTRKYFLPRVACLFNVCATLLTCSGVCTPALTFRVVHRAGTRDCGCLRTRACVPASFFFLLLLLLSREFLPFPSVSPAGRPLTVGLCLARDLYGV